MLVVSVIFKIPMHDLFIDLLYMASTLRAVHQYTR